MGLAAAAPFLGSRAIGFAREEVRRRQAAPLPRPRQGRGNLSTHLRHHLFSHSRHGERVAALQGKKKRRRRRRGGRRSSVVVRQPAAAAAAAAKRRDTGISAITTTTTSVRNAMQDDALAGGNTQHDDGSNQCLCLGQPRPRAKRQQSLLLPTPASQWATTTDAPPLPFSQQPPPTTKQ